MGVLAPLPPCGDWLFDKVLLAQVGRNEEPIIAHNRRRCARPGVLCAWNVLQQLWTPAVRGVDGRHRTPWPASDRQPVRAAPTGQCRGQHCESRNTHRRRSRTGWAAASTRCGTNSKLDVMVTRQRWLRCSAPRGTHTRTVSLLRTFGRRHGRAQPGSRASVASELIRHDWSTRRTRKANHSFEGSPSKYDGATERSRHRFYR